MNKGNGKKNGGSAMVLVVTTIAVIGVLAVTLLAVTLMTLRMKVTQMRSQENFYDAESAMDDITVGLQKRVADAAGAAYTYTMERYSGSNATIRKSNFMTMFEKELLKSNPPAGLSLVDTGHSTMYAKLYNRDALEAMISPEVKNAAVTCDLETAGGTNANVLNMDSSAGTYTFKNLRLTYIDDRGYMTVIQTDIVVSCPPIDFNQNPATPLDLTSFVFIANEQSQVSGGNITVAGSAYLGTDDEAKKRYAADYKTGSVSFEPIGDNTRLITNGTMFVNQGADVVVKGKCATWAKNVEVEHASASLGVSGTSMDGDPLGAGTTFISNDVVLGNSSNVNLGGQLYAFGTTENSKTIYGTTAVDNNPAAYSSAILLNGKDTTLDMTALDGFIIAGTAYINAERNSIAQNVAPIGENRNVPMGESITMKANQRAYMVPAQFIAPFCASGGTNPMLGDRFVALEQELADKFYGGNTAQVQSLDFLRASETAAVGVPSELAQMGVLGIQKEVYPMDSNTQMVYFFLVFASQQDANEFADSYYAKHNNLTTLTGRVAANRFNTNIAYSQAFKDKEDQPTDYTFYYNGCVLVPDGGNTKVLSGKLSTTTDDYNVKLGQNTASYQQTFAALRHKLMAGAVSSEELSKSVYDNTVKSMTDPDPKFNIPLGSKKVFATNSGGGIDPSAMMCAIVINNRGGEAYVLTNPSSDINHEATEMVGTEWLPVHVVIASGDVEVKCNFNGMIIAGGKVIIDNQNKSLKADSNLTQQALRIEDANGVRAVDYLVAGDSCLTGNAGSGNSGDNTLAFSEYVNYSNWMKQ